MDNFDNLPKEAEQIAKKTVRFNGPLWVVVAAGAAILAIAYFAF